MQTQKTTWDVFSEVPPSGAWGVNFGGGVNSTALLLVLHDNGIRPDYVLFSDTGSERPETYENIKRVESWCEQVGFPFAVTRWVRQDGTVESVHENAIRTKYLPSKAYGYAGCTYKWKTQPMERWRRANGFSPVTIAIGYDAGEKRRIAAAKKRACESAEQAPDESFWYPLVAWGIDRTKCLERIAAQGWPVVKSACFCCPNNKPAEWNELKREHPDLYAVSLEIEARAKAAGNATTKSLFRSYDPKNVGCMCFSDNSGSCESDTKTVE